MFLAVDRRLEACHYILCNVVAIQRAVAFFKTPEGIGERC